MKKEKILVITLIGILLLSSVGSLSLATRMDNINSSKSVDMLIFLSPQYANNARIKQASNRYINAVKSDIGWNTELITITSEINDFKKIDAIIERYYENYSIKACIMVGEDIDTAKGADTDYNEAPCTAPWYTTGGESSYYIDDNGDVQVPRPHQMDICISLVYPTHELSYLRKSLQIVLVFNKFSKNRDIYYTEDILVFQDSDASNKSKEIYQSMGKYGNLYYKEDPTYFEIIKSLTGSYSMYYVSGHSNPSVTYVSAGEGKKFHARYLDRLDAPFFGADGCYVEGWWSDYENNNNLDPSINRPWYGSKIFSSPHIRAMVLGFPAQYAGSPGDPYHNFIVNAIPNLTSGKTLAESMIGETYYYAADSTVYGDPTFHYSLIDITKPKEKHLYLLERKIIPLIGRTKIFGPITIETAVDPNISKVEFYVDDKLMHTDYELPFEWIFDERTFGKHDLKVIAYNKEINSGRDQIEVIIFNLGK